MKDTKTMTILAEEYVAYRRALGYSLRSEANLLKNFARYVDEVGGGGPLTTELAIGWARLPEGRSAVYWSKRLEMVRCFAKYLAQSDPSTEVPPDGVLGPAHLRKEPHIYTPEDIRRLLRAAAGLPPREGLRPRTYMCLFGLLSCSGLRVSEALKLERGDVDLSSGVITILASKRRQSRLVPLHPTATAALAAYADFRDTYCDQPRSGCFLLSERGQALAYSTVRTVFGKLRTELGWDTAGRSGRRPRIHDLRHTFACRRLLGWVRRGVETGCRVEYLSTYLGHARTTDTYWYLTATPELLAIAGKGFDAATRESGAR